MKKILPITSVAIFGLFLLGHIIFLEKPALLFEQCTEAKSCYQTFSVDNNKFYKTGFNTTLINESSGLIASRKHSGTIWTHNDSHNFPWIYAIDRFGNLQGGSYVADVWPRDWEDIATDNQGNLYLLDFARIRIEQTVYVIPEPKPMGFSFSFTQNKIRFKVPDLTRDDDGQTETEAEALFWSNNNLYLLTKNGEQKQTTLYRFPDIHSETTINLENIATLDLSRETNNIFGGYVTAADITPDGKFLVILTYYALYFFQQPSNGDNFFNEPVASILTKGNTGQAEGISWHNNEIFVSSEDGYLYLLKDVLSMIENKK